ncbi:hypothetical protein E2C01_023335 [Portunus trituberculatus]|uniref:Uncharacterized protein n=1 Tax=Portunus trituberculatus TaxID=210409 RepID=A0A5B7E7Q4_PORTR|nr:hypothetical protein [Portunus trituberculatus]
MFMKSKAVRRGGGVAWTATRASRVAGRGSSGGGGLERRGGVRALVPSRASLPCEMPGLCGAASSSRGYGMNVDSLHSEAVNLKTIKPSITKRGGKMNGKFAQKKPYLKSP